MMYNFYYDESEHSRVINLPTITGDAYYDNFITAIVGLNSEIEASIERKYFAFEEKYVQRKKKGELKSSTFKSTQFVNGFASFNKPNIEMLNDLFSLIDDKMLIYLCISSKVEYVVVQLFKDYKNSFFVDMDCVKYSIVKAILTYRPEEVLSSMYAAPDIFVDALKNFFKKRIELNKKNISLKEAENKAYESILLVLNDVEPPVSLNWNYHISFIGFDLFTKSKGIKDYSLTIDKEGVGKTYDAAVDVGINNCKEMDSTEHFGLRIADMLAGIVGKLMKSLCHSLRKGDNIAVTKTLLDKSWFNLNDAQLNLYKSLYHILLEINNDWYKIYAGNYSDDLICLLGLLDYMNHFNSTDELKEGFDLHPEYCNACMCSKLEEYFKRMHNKLPYEPIIPETNDYFRNSRGAKVFFDLTKQPELFIREGQNKFYILSVGINQAGNPLVTVACEPENICFRLPEQLYDWAVTVLEMSNKGEKLFPAGVVFSKQNNKYYADIL